jgi:hypothetical protein
MLLQKKGKCVIMVAGQFINNAPIRLYELKHTCKVHGFSAIYAKKSADEN